MDLRRQRLADAARSAAAMRAPLQDAPTIERADQRLDDEARAHGEIIRAMEATPAALAADLAPAPQPQRRSFPMTAPVSRGAPTPSGRPLNPSGQITLSPEERLIARNSFSDPNMTDAEKVRSYALQKQRLARMRAEGLYPERERG
jgi:hypothetical protein